MAEAAAMRRFGSSLGAVLAAGAGAWATGAGAAEEDAACVFGCTGGCWATARTSFVGAV